MEVQLVNGRWMLNNKMYNELCGGEKRLFEVILAFKGICKKYNL